MRPYGLLRAGFPYLKTIGEFMRMHFPTDVAPARDGRLYVIGKGSMYTKGKSGPILVTNIEDDNLGSFGWKSYEESVADACFMWPMAIRLDVEQRELYVSDSAMHTEFRASPPTASTSASGASTAVARASSTGLPGWPSTARTSCTSSTR